MDDDIQVFLNGTLAKDAEFIAHARSDVPVLVAAVKAVLAISRETERDDLGYDDQAVDNSWVAGYNAALVDVRAAIHQALGEGEKFNDRDFLFKVQAEKVF